MVPRAIFGFLAFAGTGMGMRNLRLVARSGVGKSLLLVAPGIAAVQAGHQVRSVTGHGNGARQTTR